jgi:hypothetical protein
MLQTSQSNVPHIRQQLLTESRLTLLPDAQLQVAKGEQASPSFTRFYEIGSESKFCTDEAAGFYNNPAIDLGNISTTTSSTLALHTELEDSAAAIREKYADSTSNSILSLIEISCLQRRVLQYVDRLISLPIPLAGGNEEFRARWNHQDTEEMYMESKPPTPNDIEIRRMEAEIKLKALAVDKIHAERQIHELETQIKLEELRVRGIEVEFQIKRKRNNNLRPVNLIRRFLRA